MNALTWPFLAVAFTLCVYAFAIEPQWLEVTHPQLVERPGTPRIRILQISDLHIQRIGGVERKVLEEVHTQKPDLVVFTGDMVDSIEHLDAFHSFLAEMGPVQKVAVSGNWEHWANIDLRRESGRWLKSYSLALLINEAKCYFVNERHLEVIGLDDALSSKPVQPRAGTCGSELIVTRLVLQHSPGFFAEQTSEGLKADACLSGHTHGGQVTLLGWAPITPPGSDPYVAGKYVTNACPLYVSRGVGTSILPLRLGARPEISFIDI